VGRFAPLTLLALLLPAPAIAGQEAEDEPAHTVVLDEIQIKSRKETRIETLEVREVRETPARDLGEALEAQGLAAKVRKGAIANDVVIRGFQRDNLAVTIDGARIHGACPNRMDPPTFHVDYAEVERVELKKGPFDVSSPGSLGGSLDVRTRAPEEGFASEITAGAGAFGAAETSATLSGGGARTRGLGGLALKTSEAYRSGDGTRITEVYAPTSPNRYRPSAVADSVYEMGTGWAKGTFVPAEGRSLAVSASIQKAQDVFYPYLLMDAEYDDTYRANVAYDLDAPGPFSRARAQAYGTLVQHDMTDAPRCSSSLDPAACAAALEGGWSMRTYAQSLVVGADADASIRSLGETTFGADLYLRAWDADTTRYDRAASVYRTQASVPDVRILDVGLHVQHVLPVGERWTITAGGRLDVARSEARVSRLDEYARFYPVDEDDLSSDDLLATGNVQVEWRPTASLSAFGAYGHGARLPDPQERYFALSGSMAGTTWRPGTVGLPTLDPVRNDEIDVGVKWATGRLLLKGQAFHSWLGDAITLVEVAGTLPDSTPITAKSWANVAATVWGGEASARVALTADLYLSALASYAHGQNRSADSPLQEIPPLQAGLSLRYDVARFYLEAEEVYAARQDRVDESVGEEPTDAWYITNVKAGVRLHGLRVSAGVRNLLGKTYFTHLSYLRDPFASGVRVPEPGRTVYANATYAF
jgi:iron complex outermembrane receptor protein